MILDDAIVKTTINCKNAIVDIKYTLFLNFKV